MPTFGVLEAEVVCDPDELALAALDELELLELPQPAAASESVTRSNVTCFGLAAFIPASRLLDLASLSDFRLIRVQSSFSASGGDWHLLDAGDRGLDRVLDREDAALAVVCQGPSSVGTSSVTTGVVAQALDIAAIAATACSISAPTPRPPADADRVDQRAEIGPPRGVGMTRDDSRRCSLSRSAGAVACCRTTIPLSSLGPDACAARAAAEGRPFRCQFAGTVAGPKPRTGRDTL
ncbi:MAG TPA: hypothetical protein VNR66_07040 [Solirubrobacteraceae bacterium]|nr:hypothetical protein [Solirubrobacteraceae bacterium]